MKKPDPAPLALPLEEESKTWTLTFEEESVLKATLSIPLLPSKPRALRRVGAYYQRLAQVFRERWEGELYQASCCALAEARARSRPFRPWEVRLAPSLVYLEGDLLSICIDVWERTQEPYPSLGRTGTVWDLRDGRPLALKELLGGFSRTSLLSRLEEQIAARLSTGESLYYEEYPRRLSRFFRPDRFYLTPEGVVLYFPLQSLAPRAEGLPTFFLPRAPGG